MSKTQYRLTLCLLTLSVLLTGYFSNPIPGFAQANSCGPMIDHLTRAITVCKEVNYNWACYASQLADVKPIKYRFHKKRDRRPLTVLDEINTTNEEGVVVLNLQPANRAGAVKAVLFGRVQLETTDPEQLVYTLRIEGEKVVCEETPPGMAIRTETGTRSRVTVNGVELDLGSTVFITMPDDKAMTFVNLEGRVTLTINGVPQTLPVGQQSQVAIVNGAPQFTGPPTPSPLYTLAVPQWLAQEGLPQIQNSNDTARSCLQTITFGQTITEQNFDPGQECLFTFCAEAGQVATIAMNAVDGALDPWLDLRDPEGQLLKFSNDFDEENSNSLICNYTLPVTSCDYAITARSAYNDNAGRFTLSLAHATACTPPIPRCEVVTPLGTNLRSGPGWDYPPTRLLATSTHLRPLERSETGEWLRVQVAATVEEGWVDANSRNIECEDDFEEPAPEPKCPYGLPCGDHVTPIAPTTSSAVLREQPARVQLAATGGILTFGLLIGGILLVSLGILYSVAFDEESPTP